VKRLPAVVLAMVMLAYGGAVGYLKWNETDLVYEPRNARFEAGRMNKPADSLQVSPVQFRASDDTRLSAWLIPPARPDSAAVWVLVCHGNAGNLTLTKRQDFYARLRALGVGVLAFDYRGFGESEGRTPNEAGLYRDGQAAYDFLRKVRGVPANRIVLFGHSLGSGVAVDLATHAEAAGLIVEGAYTSVPNVGQERYPIFPVRLIASNRFESIDKIERVSMPKLVLHATDDQIIPYQHGRTLYAKAKEPKQFVTLTGGHEDAYRLDPRYMEAFAAFVRRVAPNQGPAGESPFRPNQGASGESPLRP